MSLSVLKTGFVAVSAAALTGCVTVPAQQSQKDYFPGPVGNTGPVTAQQYPAGHAPAIDPNQPVVMTPQQAYMATSQACADAEVSVDVKAPGSRQSVLGRVSSVNGQTHIFYGEQSRVGLFNDIVRKAATASGVAVAGAATVNTTRQVYRDKNPNFGRNVSKGIEAAGTSAVVTGASVIIGEVANTAVEGAKQLFGFGSAGKDGAFASCVHGVKSGYVDVQYNAPQQRVPQFPPTQYERQQRNLSPYIR